MRRLLWLLSALAPVLAVDGLWVTQPAGLTPVPAGTPQWVIPPDSRLARGERPRLLLCRDDFDRLRRRADDPRLATQWAALRRQANRVWQAERDVCKQALCWRLTRDQRYLEFIRSSPEFRRPNFIPGWAATMDLIWDDLTQAERRELSDAVAAAIARDGALYWRPTLPLMVVFYEGGSGPHDAEFAARLKQDFQHTLVDWTDRLNRWAAGRGGSDMGHGYNGEHAYWEPFLAAIAWTHATGLDYVARADFARYQSAFFWYHFVPERQPLTVEKIGVTRTADDPSAVTPAHCGANHLLFLTFTREHDGLGPAWMDAFAAQEPQWDRDREALGRFLWWDPDQPALDPSTLPTTRLFPTSGHVVMRSDWSEQATFATFRCGRWGTIDGGWGRNNADNLSFTIRHGGPLAIDSGPVHGQNTQVLHFLGGGVDAGISAIGSYGRQTIAHNSLTIGDGEYEHLDWQGKPTGDVVRRGGQSVPRARDWLGQWGYEGPADDFTPGRIIAYRTHPRYDYAVGDARCSYPPQWGVRQALRSFVYLKPDVFVIYDRLELADPERTPCWLLHSLREPRASGAETPLTSAEIGPQWLYDGQRRLPHPEPGGQVAMVGDSFTVESGSPGQAGGGWLRVRTLLPAAADCERRKIGGRGHDFEVAGVQYGLRDEGYALADDPYAVRSTIGLLGWRVELRPRRAGRVVEFLHVLQAGSAGADDGALAGLTSNLTDQLCQLALTHAGRRFRLSLNRTGSPGGTMAVDDETTPLPTTVEDSWRAYAADPNYALWRDDPRYRAVIGQP